MLINDAVSVGNRGLRQFFSFFGSKVSLAKHYPEPEFDTIIEPFAGSAGYSCRHWEREILLADKDPVIVGIWEYLIRATKRDILSLPLKPESVASLTKPERDFIGFWWRRCGAVPSNIPVPWALSGKYETSFWSKETRKRIANQVEYINHWKVAAAHDDLFSLWQPQTTYFIDPPYQQQGSRYRFGSDGIDYVTLGVFCKTAAAANISQIIVCEAEGADWLPFRPLYKNRTVKHTSAVRTIQEMIYTA